MIVCQTPFRISFFGGGTDLPQWYRAHGGSVLSTTINKYARITLSEAVCEWAEIKRPAVKTIFQYLGVSEGLKVHYDGDLPARSGLGSSSSFTVGLLNALFESRGQRMSKKELADLALHIEQNVIEETVGSQDQIAAAFGGFNRIDFHNDEKYSVRPVILPQKRVDLLNGKLMLFFTGFSRIADEIEKSKRENMKANTPHLLRMREMVDEACELLQSDEGLDDFGRLLHENWRLKRSLSAKVSNSEIDSIYETGMKNGALGGKILGAGGGGFILFYVPTERQAHVSLALKNLRRVDFEFESGGSQVRKVPSSFFATRRVAKKEDGTFLQS